jgi:hypothetical protein
MNPSLPKITRVPTFGFTARFRKCDFGFANANWSEPITIHVEFWRWLLDVTKGGDRTGTATEHVMNRGADWVANQLMAEIEELRSSIRHRQMPNWKLSFSNSFQVIAPASNGPFVSLSSPALIAHLRLLVSSAAVQRRATAGTLGDDFKEEGSR